MRRTSSFLLLLVSLAGLSGAAGACSGTDESSEPRLRVVSGSAQASDVAAETAIETPASVRTVTTLGSSIALGTDTGLFLLDPSTNDVSELEVLSDDGTVASAGPISMMRQRGDGGLFVVTSEGLLHDFENVLLRSPVNDALTSPIVTLDVFGTEGQEDELWITTADKALHVSPDVTEFSVAEIGPIEAAFGIGHDRALAMSGGTAFEIDLDQGTVEVITKGLGAVHGGSRAEDGSVYLATDAGLLRRSGDGSYVHFTLADQGATPRAVHAVSAAFGSVMVETDDGLVDVHEEGSRIVAPASSADLALVVDGGGDTWSAADGSLTRVSTGTPVTFERDVAPILSEHCSSCHNDGTSGSIKIDMTNYQAVVDEADKIVKRVTSTTSPMPPAPASMLTAEQYAPLLRWRATGFVQ